MPTERAVRQPGWLGLVGHDLLAPIPIFLAWLFLQVCFFFLNGDTFYFFNKYDSQAVMVTD